MYNNILKAIQSNLKQMPNLFSSYCAYFYSNQYDNLFKSKLSFLFGFIIRNFTLEQFLEEFSNYNYTKICVFGQIFHIVSFFIDVYLPKTVICILGTISNFVSTYFLFSLLYQNYFLKEKNKNKKILGLYQYVIMFFLRVPQYLENKSIMRQLSNDKFALENTRYYFSIIGLVLYDIFYLIFSKLFKSDFIYNSIVKNIINLVLGICWGYNSLNFIYFVFQRILYFNNNEINAYNKKANYFLQNDVKIIDFLYDKNFNLFLFVTLVQFAVVAGCHSVGKRSHYMTKKKFERKENDFKHIQAIINSSAEIVISKLYQHFIYKQKYNQNEKIVWFSSIILILYTTYKLIQYFLNVKKNYISNGTAIKIIVLKFFYNMCYFIFSTYSKGILNKNCIQKFNDFEQVVYFNLYKPALLPLIGYLFLLISKGNIRQIKKVYTISVFCILAFSTYIFFLY